MSQLSSCARTLLSAAALAIVGLASAGAASAAEPQGNGIYIEGGKTVKGGPSTDSLTLGLIVPYERFRFTDNPAVSFYADYFVSDWRAPRPDGDGRRDYAQIGAIANWRYRFSEGASPWFAEAGIGATVMNRLYKTPEKEFSTAFQFTEQIGFGRSFGARGEHEVGLRFQHFSNGKIKQPNPGENFVKLRYVYRY